MSAQENEKRTAKDIFDDIPFPLKIVVVVGTLFIFYTIYHLIFVNFYTRETELKPALLRVITVAASKGIFDPAIATDGKDSLMTVTNAYEDATGLFGTNVALVVSYDNCKSWAPLGVLFESRPDTLMGPDLKTPVGKGIWRAETTGIVYDPADTGREWKAYAYRYFWGGSAPLARLYSVITMRTASNPFEMKNWSREEWVFSASPGTPPAPYANMVGGHLNTLHADLANVYFYARPSVVMVGDVMVMSLSAFVQGKDTVDRVIMLASTDHGRSWRYLGTPLRDSELAGIDPGLTRLGGASIFMQEGVLYISFALGNTASDAAGAYIFAFEDAGTGKLARDAKTGKLVPVSEVKTLRQPPSKLGGGHMSYAKSCEEGTIFSESLDNKRFDLFFLPRAPVPHK
ncbi:MAG: hypothetical protein H3C49_00110 [Alphaproteobacteria bacterium]|nr:hypothetical protein [Alphaproteobacteria bacterium]